MDSTVPMAAAGDVTTASLTLTQSGIVSEDETVETGNHERLVSAIGPDERFTQRKTCLQFSEQGLESSGFSLKYPLSEVTSISR